LAQEGKMKITSKSFDVEDVSFFEFSGGEVHVQIPELPHSDSAMIIANLENSSKIMELLMVTDALRRQNHAMQITVVIPYLPYARQDKISSYGEALSLKVFATLINAQNYHRVISYDVHSDVAAALINNFKSISQCSILNLANIAELSERVLIAPDFGASKKTRSLIPILNPSRIVQADKARDENGNIVGIEVFCDDLCGDDVLIVDDIIDGGRTFIEIAKVLRKKNAGEIWLFATHGIFSKESAPILESGINRIFTTDTFTQCDREGVTVINVVGKIL
jgi:ribose-phosphate pyrophosphokinase